ncbi:MAG: hypothetical protein KBD51_00325 [Candidatus Levybacteria bacterium]|nr:hypothetical protein [Candidatus Levybacteria bacterium]
MNTLIKLILGIIFFIILVSTPVQAQEIEITTKPTESIPMPTTSLTPSPVPTTVEYQLPYPGILPGSPLYSIKMIRDRIIETLTSDPVKKANFYLLQADKRTASALMLYEKGDEKMAETTLTKAQKYLEKSLAKAQEAKNSGKDVGDIFARIKDSSTKQKQEIEILSGKSEEKEATLTDDLEKVKNIEKNADQLKP